MVFRGFLHTTIFKIAKVMTKKKIAYGEEGVEDLMKQTSDTCNECKKPKEGKKWCSTCLFPNNWTSGNREIDTFIRESQMLSTTLHHCLLWIPFDQFSEIKEVARGGFNTVCSATWDGNRIDLLYTIENSPVWVHRNCTTKVALKHLKNSQNIDSSVLNKLLNYRTYDDFSIPKCYGLSQHPSTKEYILVFNYYEQGDLRALLADRYTDMKLRDKLLILSDIISELNSIHKRKLVHKNFHPGNILIAKSSWIDGSLNINGLAISDLGLNAPVNEPLHSKEIYGVIPFVAPEIFQALPYTAAADIYSFGMIMWMLSSGKLPFGDRPHDHRLVSDICDGDLWAYYSEHLSALKPTNIEITKRSRNSHYEILTNTHPDAVYYSRPISKFTSQGSIYPPLKG
ncbi:19298_t:CDS:2 [Racocetra persica]|uniref:19298_t:CDS:1 n=1 Tax=Racocetra persica TaxID=160502 RepID=A0ACA9LKG6_9GLOM|nr:19298_t:CDS:2 [Racocetra persica]